MPDDEPLPYNPLDRMELAKSVERALLARTLVPLPPIDTFPGAGLYAIYYSGDFPAYAPIAPPAQPPGEVPIYVGRARPSGARQGEVGGFSGTTRHPRLFNRLREHAASIQAAEDHAAGASTGGLQLADFRCRYLVADELWVPLGEALLIGHYRPLWNVVVDGFGNHAPGAGRQHQRRSQWDVLHPGRAWASNLPLPPRSVADVTARIAEHLVVQPPPDLDSIPVVEPELGYTIGDEPQRPRDAG